MINTKWFLIIVSITISQSLNSMQSQQLLDPRSTTARSACALLRLKNVIEFLKSAELVSEYIDGNEILLTQDEIALKRKIERKTSLPHDANKLETEQQHSLWGAGEWCYRDVEYVEYLHALYLSAKKKPFAVRLTPRELTASHKPTYEFKGGRFGGGTFITFIDGRGRPVTYIQEEGCRPLFIPRNPHTSDSTELPNHADSRYLPFSKYISGEHLPIPLNTGRNCDAQFSWEDKDKKN